MRRVSGESDEFPLCHATYIEIEFTRHTVHVTVRLRCRSGKRKSIPRLFQHETCSRRGFFGIRFLLITFSIYRNGRDFVELGAAGRTARLSAQDGQEVVAV